MSDGQGRSILSRNIFVRPQFREEPDVKKFGTTLIAMAMRKVGMRATNLAGMGDDVM